MLRPGPETLCGKDSEQISLLVYNVDPLLGQQKGLSLQIHGQAGSGVQHSVGIRKRCLKDNGSVLRHPGQRASVGHHGPFRAIGHILHKIADSTFSLNDIIGKIGIGRQGYKNLLILKGHLFRKGTSIQIAIHDIIQIFPV